MRDLPAKNMCATKAQAANGMSVSLLCSLSMSTAFRLIFRVRKEAGKLKKVGQTTASSRWGGGATPGSRAGEGLSTGGSLEEERNEGCIGQS